MTLIERDYDGFTDRNAYPAAKLLTIFAEHPVVFLGYSLSDKYIREIINSIAKAVGPARISALEERIYFVEWDDDPSSSPKVSRYYLEVSTGQALPVTRVQTHSFLLVFDALARLVRPFPARVLRELRKYVFDLVTHPEPGQARESVRVLPFDSKDAEGLRVVFGVGEFSDAEANLISSIGFRALTRDDLARDVLGIRERGIDAKNVLRMTLPDILRGASNSCLPVMKYLREVDLSAEGAIDQSTLRESVQRLIARVPVPAEGNRRRFEAQHRGKLRSPRELFAADLATYYKFDSLLCLDSADYDLDELRNVLVEQFDLPENAENRNRPSMFKAISHYDRLRWGAGGVIDEPSIAKS
ncbi:MAG: hypothetical protein K0R97_936 [Oerskovia sp.]|jgi:hypothetical protein|nr:hypothetical protein [Oerskovia sp.]